MESVLIIYLLLAVIFVGLVGVGWLLWQLLRQQGRLLLRLEAVEAGQGAPGQVLPLVNGPGETSQIQDLPPRQKVFGIGLSKTGTSSLTEALELLGYRTAHGPVDPVTREEFYRFFATGADNIHLTILNRYDALTDAPVCCLYQALDKAYPGSKFILTVREKQAWLRSYQRRWEASDRLEGPRSGTPIAQYTRFINQKLFGHAGRKEDTEAILSPAYDRYIAEVLDYFKERPHDLLILDICGGEGWNRLAPFLEVPIPEVPFPWENRTPRQEEPDEGKDETSDATSVQQNGNGMMVRPEPTVPAIGDPAPDFSLPDLEGNLVKLSDLRGSPTLVLFWRPSCDFCQHMLTELQAWEAKRPKDAPNLIVVSSESVADNQAMGLRSPIVLDHTVMSVGSQFGAAGTPMAVLVDGEGRIASGLAAGAAEVLALAQSVQDRSAILGV